MNQTSLIRRFGVLALANIAVTLGVNAGVISDATSRADVVVVGSMSPTRTETADAVSFDLTVERVLKGGATPPMVHVEHAWKRKTLVLFSSPTIMNGDHSDGIWFLKRTAGSSWDLLTVNGPDGLLPSLYFPASVSIPTTYQYMSSASLTDKVALEVAAAVWVSGTNPEVLLHSLGSLDSSVIHGVLSDFLESEKPSFQAIGLSGLLTRGDQGAIAKLSQLWPSIREDASKFYVIAAIGNTFRDTTANSIQQLAAIADTSEADADLRNAIVKALSSIHSKEALPFLASLLTSEDSGERMSAVIGISSFANGCPIQTPANVASMDYIHFKNPSPYRTRQTIAAFAFGPVESERESELVAFWIDWWNQNKAAILKG